MENLNQNLFILKLSERRFKEENRQLNCKFVTLKEENYTNFNMMQLRGNVIKILTDKDESNKARILMLMRDLDEYKHDFQKVVIKLIFS